jgi:hypothetical protein
MYRNKKYKNSCEAFRINLGLLLRWKLATSKYYWAMFLDPAGPTEASV